MFKISFTRSFDTRYRKIAKGNTNLEKRTSSVIKMLSKDPYNKTLRSHRVVSKLQGKKWSSRISGDIRIIWEIDRPGFITLYDIGSHSGSHKVYR